MRFIIISYVFLSTLPQLLVISQTFVLLSEAHCIFDVSQSLIMYHNLSVCLRGGSQHLSTGCLEARPSGISFQKCINIYSRVGPQK